MSYQAVVPIASKFGQSTRIEEPILIGKDILELITGAMYVEPLCIYREYVQNACDSIDEAMQTDVYVKGVQPAIDISIDQGDRSVKLRDTGTGVSQREFVQRLTAIGGSKKRGTKLRGLRGVGRLSGLGHCQELVFRSRALGDSKVSELAWNGRRLRNLIRSADQATSLEDAIRQVAEFRTLSSTEYPAHFFEVELRKVTRVKNDTLLNEKEIRAYLSQVAPVPITQEFRFHREIEGLLGDHDLNTTYTISINDGEGQVYRPFQNTFPIRNRVSDRFIGFKPVLLPSMDGNVGAVGWILDHSYLGAIPQRAMIAGLRFRIGNIQVGSSDSLAPYFPEPRFNSWCVGELHIVDHKVVPNGRRDDFEPSAHYQHLLGQIGPLLRKLAKTCRDRSAVRNKLRRANTSLEEAREALSLLGKKGKRAYLVQFVEQRVEAASREVAKLSTSNEFPSTEQEDLTKRSKQIESELRKRLLGLGRRNLRRGNQTNRAAYEKVLGLIYKCSFDTKEAHRLVAKITRALKLTT